ISNYATTFVAQYTGAKRHHRVGPAVWQSLFFSVGGGLGFFWVLLVGGALLGFGGGLLDIQDFGGLVFRWLGFFGLCVVSRGLGQQFLRWPRAKLDRASGGWRRSERERDPGLCLDLWPLRFPFDGNRRSGLGDGGRLDDVGDRGRDSLFLTTLPEKISNSG